VVDRLAEIDRLAASSEVRKDLSVVVPAYNEVDSLPHLIERLEQVLDPLGYDYEILIIDDGSTDGTFDALAELAATRPRLHGISFSRNFGKAAALSAGFHTAVGDLIVTMDADLQDDPEEVPNLLAAIDEGYDLVSGWKQDRKDSFIKNQTSKVFNWATSRMCGLRLHDFNCGLKAYRRRGTGTVRLYGDMHRYVPALAHMAGFRVKEIKVRHHARRYGVTKYGPARFVNGLLDLLTVFFLNARSTSPLHFFGRIGLASAVVGGGICAYFLVLWLLGHGLHVRPLMILGLVLLMLALQFVSLGLVAELVISGHHPEKEYRVRRRI